MKKKSLLFICFCVSALFVLLFVLTKQFPALFSSIFAFPFEQVADGLSILSKAGRFGNGLAVALLVSISAIPAMAASRYEKGKETLPERVSLYVLSGTILLALYGMVNPGLFRPTLSEGFAEYAKLIKAVFGVAVWAVVILYIVLRLIRLFRQGDKKQLFKYMQAVLCALCIVFAVIATVSLVNGVTTLPDSSKTGIDKGFEVVLIIASIVPYLFDIAIILRLLDLFKIASEEEQDGIIEMANRVSHLCCVALAVTASITVAVNLIQIVLMRWLSNVNVTAEVPVISLAFTVMILLFSRILIENKKLRDDNSLFI